MHTLAQCVAHTHMVLANNPHSTTDLGRGRIRRLPRAVPLGLWRIRGDTAACRPCRPVLRTNGCLIGLQQSCVGQVC